MSTGDKYYWLAPGTDVVRVGEDAVLFKSDSVVLRLEGKSAVVFAGTLIPQLDGRREFSEILVSFPDLDAAQLAGHLDSLVQERVLRSSEAPRSDGTKDHAAGSAGISGICRC